MAPANQAPVARAAVLWLAVLLLALALGPARDHALAAEIARHRIDPANVEYTGLDLNGDVYPDRVIVGSLKRSTDQVFFFGRADGRQDRRFPGSFSEEELGSIQTLILEADLDGDQIMDLLVLNERRVAARGLDDPGLFRYLENSIYIGSPGGSLAEFAKLAVADEHRQFVLNNARRVLLERGLKSP